jgi:hypothetical protein
MPLTNAVNAPCGTPWLLKSLKVATGGLLVKSRPASLARSIFNSFPESWLSSWEDRIRFRRREPHDQRVLNWATTQRRSLRG